VPKRRSNAARPAPLPKRTRRDPRPPARREEVLEAGLELVAEHGVAGASLRRLARKLGMSQPSLYHYFRSKDDLIAQIVEYSTARMLAAGDTLAPPARVEDLPRFAKDTVLALYASESHPRFVRFLFLVAIESKRHRPLIERMFEERLNPSFALLAAGFADDPLRREQLRQVLRMIVHSVGFMLLDERALRRHPEASRDTLDYAEWAVRAGERLLGS